MENEKGPEKDRRVIGRLANEHKLFSGFAGSLLIATIAVLALLAGNDDSSQPSYPSSQETSISQSPIKDQPTTSGSESTKDEDGDGVPDSEDECSEEPGGKSNGCPAVTAGVALSDFIEKSEDAYLEGGEREYLKTDNVETGQVTVGGVTDPLGIAMEISGPEEAGAFTIFTNGAFETIEGRVGITTEPCSAGSVAFVAVRDGEGEPLWPANGKLRQVRRTAAPFRVRIASQGAVVLYAQATKAPQSCDEYVGRTAVGWVHTRLNAAE